MVKQFPQESAHFLDEKSNSRTLNLLWLLYQNFPSFTHSSNGISVNQIKSPDSQASLNSLIHSSDQLFFSDPHFRFPSDWEIFP